MVEAEALTQVADGVLIRPMLTIERAVDDFLADGRARGWPEATTIRTYARTLYKFADTFPTGTDVAKITSDDIRAFRATRQRRRLAPSTLANEESHLSSFTGWLLGNGKIRRDPMASVRRTRRPRPEDVDVLAVSTADVLRLLDEAKPGRELNAVAIAAYLGARRTAIARLQLGDYTARVGWIRFREKGKKTLWKLVPEELAQILDTSISRGDIWAPPNDYLVPPGRAISASARDSTIIWTTIKEVARRAGVETHVHALRAAFACFYLENNPGDLVGLSEALGHTSLAMTMVYLRRLERDTRMAPLRSLSWQSARSPTVAQRSDSTTTSLDGDTSTVRVPLETRLPRDDVTMRSPRQLSELDLLGDLLRGVRNAGAQSLEDAQTPEASH